MTDTTHGTAPKAHKGLFITLEGGEGSGKSTQITLLAERLRAAGFSVRELREPGGTRVSEAIRSILLDPTHTDLDARAELLLYQAARAQLCAEVIKPALEAGEIVVCDRFFDSTTAYQGYGRGLALADIQALNLTATGGLVPDATLVLDIDPEEGLRRATTAGADRLEGEDMDFHRRVRAGFVAIAHAEPQRVRVIPAHGARNEVAARIGEALRTIPVLCDVWA